MGRTAIVRGFEKRTENGAQYADVKCDIGGGDTVTARYYPPPGFFSEPLDGDEVAIQEGAGAGKWIALGFFDTALAPLTTARGESVVYSRSGPGTVAAKILLKADGSIVINDEVTISPTGAIESTDEITAIGIPLSTHTHGYVNDIFTVPDGPSVETPSETDPPS